MNQQKTVRISVEVRSGTARFRVGVQADSIGRALSMVGGGTPEARSGLPFRQSPRASSPGGHRPWRGSTKKEVVARRAGI